MLAAATTWLEQRERAARGDNPAGGWSARAIARLTAGERTFGHSWTRKTIAELVAEVREEAEDIGGWAALARLQLQRSPSIDPDVRHQVMIALDEAAEHAVFIDAHLRYALIALSAGGVT